MAVDVMRIEESTTIENLAEYHAIVIGSPVISGVWMPEAIAFVERDQAILQQKPIAYFLASMELALSTDPSAIEKVNPVFDDVLAQVPNVTPIAFGLFAGALDYSKMSLANRILYQLFSPDDTDGDYRDWDAIRAWATTLRPSLLGYA